MQSVGAPTNARVKHEVQLQYQPKNRIHTRLREARSGAKLRIVKHDLKSIVGARVRAARKSAGLTQAELADTIDRTVEAVSNIERGKSLPPLDLLQHIGTATGWPLTHLVDVPQDASASPEQARLEMRLLAAGRALPIDQLRIAVVQIEALRPAD